MKIIAVIPARGGSKRIPKKNIIDFMGKPMIAWTIEAALKSKLFDRVIVSTDDYEFASISKEYGCDVPFLRDSSADDLTPVSIATIRAVEQAENYYNEEYDIVINGSSAGLTGLFSPPKDITVTNKTIFYDLNYSLGKTPFCEWSLETSKSVYDGTGMLVNQAAQSFKLWFGVTPETDQVSEDLKSLAK